MGNKAIVHIDGLRRERVLWGPWFSRTLRLRADAPVVTTDGHKVSGYVTGRCARHDSAIWLAVEGVWQDGFLQGCWKAMVERGAVDPNEHSHVVQHIRALCESTYITPGMELIAGSEATTWSAFMKRLDTLTEVVGEVVVARLVGTSLRAACMLSRLPIAVRKRNRETARVRRGATARNRRVKPAMLLIAACLNVGATGASDSVHRGTNHLCHVTGRKCNEPRSWRRTEAK